MFSSSRTATRWDRLMSLQYVCQDYLGRRIAKIGKNIITGGVSLTKNSPMSDFLTSQRVYNIWLQPSAENHRDVSLMYQNYNWNRSRGSRAVNLLNKKVEASTSRPNTEDVANDTTTEFRDFQAGNHVRNNLLDPWLPTWNSEPKPVLLWSRHQKSHSFMHFPCWEGA